MRFTNKTSTKGNAARYMTRNQALRKLQISLKDFRRLCILKGVFPRDPKKKALAKTKTYYYTKDIQFLNHEPLLNKFREFKVFLRKLSRATGRHELSEAKRLQDSKPIYTIDHIIKERYPSFFDALRDLDDALCMVHLFASLPVTSQVPAERITNCARLASDFQFYVTLTHSMRKSFVSVRGIYLQAEIQGQKLTWLVPHAFSQFTPSNVDYRIMLTFLELYETLLAFVNFRLFRELGISYPSPFPTDSDGLLNFSSIDLSKFMTEVTDDQFGEEERRLQAEDPALSKALEERLRHHSLFKGCRFFLSREVPCRVLQVLIMSHGGEVGWNGAVSPFDETDEYITHQVVDRDFQSHRFLSREYIQPQWVFDCINYGVVLPVDRYLATKTTELPPHLSPFVDNEAEGYVPAYAQEVQEYIDRQRALASGMLRKSAASVAVTETAEEESSEEEKETPAVVEEPVAAPAPKKTSTVVFGSGARKAAAAVSARPVLVPVAGDGDDDGVDDDAGEVDESGEPTKELRKMMMTKKKRKLYDRIEQGIARHKDKSSTLHARRVQSESANKQRRSSSM